MARTINADLKLAMWFDEWDWTEISGRSYTRWSSNNNFSSPANYKQADMRLTYNPGQSVVNMPFHFLMRRFRAAMGFRSIVLRADWTWRYGGGGGDSGVFQTLMRNFLKSGGYPDISQCTYAKKATSPDTDWYGGGYAPQLGHDVSSEPIASQSLDQSGLANGAEFPTFDITDYFAQQLLDNEDLWMELTQVTSSSVLWIGTSEAIERPHLDVGYFMPVEIFTLLPDGRIDLTSLLNTDDNPINLGAYQRGQVGAAQQFKLKNFSADQISELELWDDYPEWTIPAADAGNTGSGAISYVEPFEDCVSQKWTVKFSSSTAYEVLAEAYGDNLTGLHPQYDADPSWTHTTATDWTSPGGELRIPAAAFSGTPASGDLFVFYTYGNTTNNTWPADSNDQVEMCDDVSDAPSGDWRPINAQRTELTATAVVNATTVAFTVKRIDTSKWPVGDYVFVANSNTIDNGTIQGVTATTVTITGLTVTSNAYAIGDTLATTLPFRSLNPTPWGQLNAASGVSQAQKDRLFMAQADQRGFTVGNEITVQSLSDPSQSETLTILGIYGTYLTTTVDMANDYEIGATVIELGAGEVSLWLRVVGDPTTQEERKDFRLALLA